MKLHFVFWNLLAVHERRQNVGGKISGFLSMTTLLHTQCSLSRSFLWETELQWFHSHPTALISIQHFPVFIIEGEFRGTFMWMSKGNLRNMGPQGKYYSKTLRVW